MEGARTATGEVLVFLDSHIETNVNWLPPLLEPIVIDPRTATVPILDNFRHDISLPIYLNINNIKYTIGTTHLNITVVEMVLVAFSIGILFITGCLNVLKTLLIQSNLHLSQLC